MSIWLDKILKLFILATYPVELFLAKRKIRGKDLELSQKNFMHRERLKRNDIFCFNVSFLKSYDCIYLKLFIDTASAKYDTIGAKYYASMASTKYVRGCKVRHAGFNMAILALITSGNNYVGLGSRRGGGHPPPAGLEWQRGGGGVQWHSLHQQHSCKQHSRLKVTIVI